MCDSDSVTDSLVRAGISKGRAPGISNGCVRDVVETHDQRGWNYVWLAPLFGLLQWIEFREPSGTGEFRTYSRFYWARHGSVVSHHPDELVREHVKIFVGPNRSIDLRFYFQTPAGYVYSTEPTKLFYELEAAFFRRHGLCLKNHENPSPKELAKYAELASEEGLAPHWGPEVILRPVLEAPPPKLKSKNQNTRKLSWRKRHGGFITNKKVATIINS